MGKTVDHPEHYSKNRKIEPIDVIEDWDLNFHLGNVVKYIGRYKRKGSGIEDIKKAKWYLDRYLKRRIK